MARMPMIPGFTEDDLRDRAGCASFGRGQGCLGQVADLDISDTGITATVAGTDDYGVWLAPGDQDLRGSCSCPSGREGFFCKHCVAVGLTVLGPQASVREQVTATRTRRGAVAAWLESLSREDLRAEVRGLLRDDRDLRRRFELRAAAASGDTRSIRRSAQALVTPMRGGYLAYDEADAHADGVYEAAAAIDGLAKAGAGQQAIAAAREARDDLGWGHLAIAQDLDRAGRGDEALTWAQRGLREAGRPVPPLVEYLADRYAGAGRASDLLALRRDRFAAGRTLASYQRLRQAAMAAGQWPAEREPALAALAADARVPRPRVPGALDWTGPVLVDALLDEGVTDAAWAAAAQVPGAASPRQWLRLADLVAATRPADALAVYGRLVEPLRSHTGDRVYEQVARLLRAARTCHQALGTTAEFEDYLAGFRADQKRKPNLMRMLDRSGLTARPHRPASPPGRADAGRAMA
jgi:uncharacterized Zn finger protein